MEKQLKVIYTIFELEFAPPFKLQRDEPETPNIYDKHSKRSGWYNQRKDCFYVDLKKNHDILTKIKQTFNVDEISDDDVYHIAKHLLDWLPNHLLSLKINNVVMYSFNTREPIKYPK